MFLICKERYGRQPFFMPEHPLIIQRSKQPMPETIKLYLDQMFKLDIAEALRGEDDD